MCVYRDILRLSSCTGIGRSLAMAEMVGSAAAEEILKQAFAGLIGKQQHEEGRDEEEHHMERLEMAQIKLEAAVETSCRWQVMDASLLRWRKKLKCAARECDDTLRGFKQRAAEDEAREQEARGSSFPRRWARATKSIVTALLSHDNSYASSSSAAVRRFERLADSAGEFLRFAELGGTPRRYMFADPLIGHLLAGQELRYRLVRRGQYHLFCVRPIRLEEDRGREAALLFMYEDDEAPEKNLCLGSILRLSESTDIVGTIIKFLDLLVAPHFKSTAESVSKELAQLPTQDFWWVPYVDSSHRKLWNSIHSSMTQWFRPDPLCCKQHEPMPSYGGSSSSSTMKLSYVADLEPVIQLSLNRHIPLSEYNKHRSKAAEGDTSCHKNVPHLKIGLVFAPHGSSEGLLPSVESSAIEVIDGAEQSGAHTNISLEQLDEFMLPKAIDCLRQKAELTVYQMFWRSKHGAAFLLVRKTGLMKMPPRHVTGVGDRRFMIQRRRDPKLEKWVQLVKDFLDLWAAHAPRKLQSSIVEWIQKVDEKQN
ncbi:hypothetical protein GQ55_3G433100 [Panicum hallii var. hallii]|uniref:Rx N-terminal domain-containing protein n=2 Tax=Panicum hallii var. hallii TaxID=1504633 RepID=A0A2T7EHW7_9POAL|nr:hypothetical protein GQ55_3G433100 [Panicum hallii var. hallii]